MNDTMEPVAKEQRGRAVKPETFRGLTWIVAACLLLTLAALGAMYALDRLGLNQAEQALQEWRQKG